MRAAGARRGRSMTVVVTVLIVIIAAGAAVIGYMRLRTDVVSERIADGGVIGFVFMLPIDDLAPSLEVLLLDVDTGRAALLFVPGSVGVVLRDLQRMDAIAALYSPDGRQRLVDRLGEILDFDVDFYLDLSYSGLSRFIDVLGGAELLIPEPIQTTVGDRRVLLPSGGVVVDGDMAQDFLSFRADGESDASRVERVHRLMQALLRSLASGGDSLLVDATVRRMLYDAVVTNLNRRAFDTLLATIDRLDTDRVILLRTLGNVQNVEGRPLLFPYEDGSLVRHTVKQTIVDLGDPLGAEVADVNPSVEVLNGTGTNGLAARAAILFESFGYQVVAVANADHNWYERTIIVDRRRDWKQVRRAAAVIRCDASVAQVEDAGVIDLPSATVDITVILGVDFDGHSCQSR